jgi:FkbM family methyltransferase
MSEQLASRDRLIFDNPPIRIKHCRRGPMMYLARDQYMGRSLDLYGESSELEFELFGQFLKPGMIVVDAGAHIGTHAIYFAQTVGNTGTVIAVEPQRIIHQILCANVALNALMNVVTLHGALGDKPGTAKVFPLDYRLENNFGGLEIWKAEAGEPVKIVTLDSLGLTRCHFIKIDVEGMEGNVLRGARETITRHWPLLYVENDRQDKSAALIALLFELGYRLYWDIRPMFNPANFAGIGENVFGLGASFNMLCVPRSAGAAITGFREIMSPDDVVGPAAERP